MKVVYKTGHLQTKNNNKVTKKKRLLLAFQDIQSIMTAKIEIHFPLQETYIITKAIVARLKAKTVLAIFFSKYWTCRNNMLTTVTTFKIL